MEWSQIKTFFNVPIKLVNLASSFKTLVADKKVSLQKIEIVLNILSQIQAHNETSLHEAFYPLYNFLTAATNYYGIFAFEETPREKVEEAKLEVQNIKEEKPETKAPVPMHYLELPRSRADITGNNSYQNHVKIENVSVDSKQKQEQNNIKDIDNVDVFGKETVKVSDILKNKESLKPPAAEVRCQSVKSASKSPMKRNAEKPGQKENKRATSTQRTREIQPKKEIKPKKETKEFRELKEIKNFANQEEEDFRDEVLYDVRVEPAEAEVLISEIEVKERESREYRHKVKRMLIDHDRYVRKNNPKSINVFR